MTLLDEIACKESTDRSSVGWHDYFSTYEQVLGHLRAKPIVLVEIGVLDGGGIRTWAKWLEHPEARVIGVDTETFRYKGCSDPRVLVLTEDAGSPRIAKVLPRRIDVLLDDGPHFAAQQLATFSLLWPQVAPGGFYCMEDLHTAWSPAHCNGRMTIMEFLNETIASMQGRGPDARARREQGDSDIAWVMVRKGLAILKKHE